MFSDVEDKTHGRERERIVSKTLFGRRCRTLVGQSGTSPVYHSLTLEVGIGLSVTPGVTHSHRPLGYRGLLVSGPTVGLTLENSLGLGLGSSIRRGSEY